ncbi:MAG: tripartite tricarboxylate transporter TctB family protein [Geminicoccaceae bacterium]
MQLDDRLIGILAVIGGIAVIAGTFGFREVPGQQFGSAFFPRIVGSALMITGAVIFLSAKGGGPWIALPDWMRGRSAFSGIAVLAAGIFWLLTAPLLGFMATTFLTMAALMFLAGGRPLTSLLISAGMTALLHLIFAVLLRVPLPYGLLEKLLA